MTRRARTLALLLGGLAAAGCSSSAKSVTAHVWSPAAVVPFYGVTSKSLRGADGGLLVQSYLGVAAARGDELRVVDQRDLNVVVGPGLVFAASVPTDTRPLLLASARLNDDVITDVQHNSDNSTTWKTTYLADVLVAVSGGERRLQLVDTWATTGQVFDTVDLAPLLVSGSAEILSLTGMPARGTAGAADYVPARIVVAAADAPAGSPDGALTMGKLIVVEFDRVTAPTVAHGKTYPVGAVLARTIDPVANVLELGYLPSDVQVEPDFPVTANATLLPDGTTPFTQVPDGYKAVGTRLFVASRDPIVTPAPPAVSGYGVAVFETNPGGSASLIGASAYLDAKAPTLSVAAGWVDERVVDQYPDVEDQDQRRYCSPETFEGAPQLRVYAGLAPEGCGTNQPIACGIVTLDLATGQLAPDPAARVVIPTSAVVIPDEVKVPAQPFRAPVAINGNPLHITIVHAAAGYNAVSFRLHPQGWPLDPPGGNSTRDPALPSTACPTQAPAVPAGSGQGLSLMRLYAASGIRYTSAFALVSSSDGRTYWIDLTRWAPPSETDPLYGVNTRATVTATGVITNSVALADGSGVVTGATLGMYDLLTGQVVNGTYTLPDAIYAWPGFTDTDTWSITYQGVLSRLDGQSGSLLTANGETYLAAQSPVDGGTPVVNAPIADPALGVRVGDTVGAWTRADTQGCQLNLADPGHSFQARVEAVLDATQAAAAGIDAPGGAVRLSFPDPQTTACFDGLKYFADPTKANPVLFHVRASGFVLLNGKLGYLGRPALDTLFAAGWKLEDTGDAEQQALSRKARRLFYPASGPCPYEGSGSVSITTDLVGCYPGFPYLSDPLQPGPLIFFKLGLMSGSGPPIAGDAVIFNTQSGRIVTGRQPPSGGALPAQAIPFDWTVVPNTPEDHSNDPIRLAVPFLDDQVYLFSPSGTNAYDWDIR